MPQGVRKCPVCGDPLAGVAFRNVELDLCYSCRGIWLDPGELGSLLGAAPRAEELLDSRRGYGRTREKTRPCPDCGTAMRKYTLGLDSPVVVDHCPKGHGEWFDRGELSSLLQQGGLDLPELMTKLLNRILGISGKE